MKFIYLFILKTDYEGELQILASNIFHSFNADGKTRIKKKVLPLKEMKTVKQHS